MQARSRDKPSGSAASAGDCRAGSRPAGSERRVWPASRRWRLLCAGKPDHRDDPRHRIGGLAGQRRGILESTRRGRYRPLPARTACTKAHPVLGPLDARQRRIVLGLDAIGDQRRRQTVARGVQGDGRRRRDRRPSHGPGNTSAVNRRHCGAAGSARTRLSGSGRSTLAWLNQRPPICGLSRNTRSGAAAPSRSDRRQTARVENRHSAANADSRTRR